MASNEFIQKVIKSEFASGYKRFHSYEDALKGGISKEELKDIQAFQRDPKTFLLDQIKNISPDEWKNHSLMMSTMMLQEQEYPLNTVADILITPQLNRLTYGYPRYHLDIPEDKIDGFYYLDGVNHTERYTIDNRDEELFNYFPTSYYHSTGYHFLKTLVTDEDYPNCRNWSNGRYFEIVKSPEGNYIHNTSTTARDGNSLYKLIRVVPLFKSRESIELFGNKPIGYIVKKDGVWTDTLFWSEVYRLHHYPESGKILTMLTNGQPASSDDIARYDDIISRKTIPAAKWNFYDYSFSGKYHTYIKDFTIKQGDTVVDHSTKYYSLIGHLNDYGERINRYDPSNIIPPTAEYPALLKDYLDIMQTLTTHPEFRQRTDLWKIFFRVDESTPFTLSFGHEPNQSSAHFTCYPVYLRTSGLNEYTNNKVDSIYELWGDEATLTDREDKHPSNQDTVIRYSWSKIIEQEYLLKDRSRSPIKTKVHFDLPFEINPVHRISDTLTGPAYWVRYAPATLTELLSRPYSGDVDIPGDLPGNNYGHVVLSNKHKLCSFITEVKQHYIGQAMMARILHIPETTLNELINIRDDVDQIINESIYDVNGYYAHPILKSQLNDTLYPEYASNHMYKDNLSPATERPLLVSPIIGKTVESLEKGFNSAFYPNDRTGTAFRDDFRKYFKTEEAYHKALMATNLGVKVLRWTPNHDTKAKYYSMNWVSVPVHSNRYSWGGILDEDYYWTKTNLNFRPWLYNDYSAEEERLDDAQLKSSSSVNRLAITGYSDYGESPGNNNNRELLIYPFAHNKDTLTEAWETLFHDDGLGNRVEQLAGPLIQVEALGKTYKLALVPEVVIDGHDLTVTLMRDKESYLRLNPNDETPWNFLDINGYDTTLPNHYVKPELPYLISCFNPIFYHPRNEVIGTDSYGILESGKLQTLFKTDDLTLDADNETRLLEFHYGLTNNLRPDRVRHDDLRDLIDEYRMNNDNQSFTMYHCRLIWDKIEWTRQMLFFGNISISLFNEDDYNQVMTELGNPKWKEGLFNGHQVQPLKQHGWASIMMRLNDKGFSGYTEVITHIYDALFGANKTREILTWMASGDVMEYFFEPSFIYDPKPVNVIIPNEWVNGTWYSYDKKDSRILTDPVTIPIEHAMYRYLYHEMSPADGANSAFTDYYNDPIVNEAPYIDLNTRKLDYEDKTRFVIDRRTMFESDVNKVGLPFYGYRSIGRFMDYHNDSRVKDKDFIRWNNYKMWRNYLLKFPVIAHDDMHLEHPLDIYLYAVWFPREKDYGKYQGIVDMDTLVAKRNELLNDGDEAFFKKYPCTPDGMSKLLSEIEDWYTADLTDLTDYVTNTIRTTGPLHIGWVKLFPTRTQVQVILAELPLLDDLVKKGIVLEERIAYDLFLSKIKRSYTTKAWKGIYGQIAGIDKNLRLQVVSQFNPSIDGAPAGFYENSYHGWFLDIDISYPIDDIDTGIHDNSYRRKTQFADMYAKLAWFMSPIDLQGLSIYDLLITMYHPKYKEECRKARFDFNQNPFYNIEHLNYLVKSGISVRRGKTSPSITYAQFADHLIAVTINLLYQELSSRNSPYYKMLTGELVTPKFISARDKHLTEIPRTLIPAVAKDGWGREKNHGFWMTPTRRDYEDPLNTTVYYNDNMTYRNEYYHEVPRDDNNASSLFYPYRERKLTAPYPKAEKYEYRGIYDIYATLDTSRKHDLNHVEVYTDLDITFNNFGFLNYPTFLLYQNNAMKLIDKPIFSLAGYLHAINGGLPQLNDPIGKLILNPPDVLSYYGLDKPVHPVSNKGTLTGHAWDDLNIGITTTSYRMGIELSDQLARNAKTFSFRYRDPLFLKCMNNLQDKDVYLIDLIDNPYNFPRQIGYHHGKYNFEYLSYSLYTHSLNTDESRMNYKSGIGNYSDSSDTYNNDISLRTHPYLPDNKVIDCAPNYDANKYYTMRLTMYPYGHPHSAEFVSSWYTSEKMDNPLHGTADEYTYRNKWMPLTLPSKTTYYVKSLPIPAEPELYIANNNPPYPYLLKNIDTQPHYTWLMHTTKDQFERSQLTSTKPTDKIRVFFAETVNARHRLTPAHPAWVNMFKYYGNIVKWARLEFLNDTSSPWYPFRNGFKSWVARPYNKFLMGGLLDMYLDYIPASISMLDVNECIGILEQDIAGIGSHSAFKYKDVHDGRYSPDNFKDMHRLTEGRAVYKSINAIQDGLMVYLSDKRRKQDVFWKYHFYNCIINLLNQDKRYHEFSFYGDKGLKYHPCSALVDTLFELYRERIHASIEHKEFYQIGIVPSVGTTNVKYICSRFTAEALKQSFIDNFTLYRGYQAKLHPKKVNEALFTFYEKLGFPMKSFPKIYGKVMRDGSPYTYDLQYFENELLFENGSDFEALNQYHYNNVVGFRKLDENVRYIHESYFQEFERLGLIPSDKKQALFTTLQFSECDTRENNAAVTFIENPSSTHKEFSRLYVIHKYYNLYDTKSNNHAIIHVYTDSPYHQIYASGLSSAIAPKPELIVYDTKSECDKIIQSITDSGNKVVWLKPEPR